MNVWVLMSTTDEGFNTPVGVYGHYPTACVAAVEATADGDPCWVEEFLLIGKDTK
jgi:hypothetical protein